MPYPPLKAAPGLIGEILEKERAHGALEANMELADFALGQRHDLYAGELRPFEEARDVFLVARKAIQRLGQNNIRPLPVHQLKQLLVARAERARAREGIICQYADHLPALTLRAYPADTHLVIDRGIPLILR